MYSVKLYKNKGFFRKNKHPFRKNLFTKKAGKNFRVCQSHIFCVPLHGYYHNIYLFMLVKKVEIDFLFETSWEVCNKVGGIYTVLSTKAKTLQTLYKDKVIFIGPDVWSENHPSPFFKESKTLLKKWRQSLDLPHNISVRVGRWDIPGKPIAILVKFAGLFDVKNDFYAQMWQQFKVDSLHAYGDYDEACAFGLASAMVVENLTKFLFPELSKKNKVIAHFDEWTTGMGLLYLKAHCPDIATIFTTHATSIGRSICGNGKELYAYFKNYNGDQMAQELNMVAKHSLEKAAAHYADCFTTVSDITAEECEQLLGIRPHVVTPNGFEDDFVPASSLVYKRMRAKSRKKMIDVAEALTGCKFNDDIFIMCTAGRCEYRNKGIDVFIDSLKNLTEVGLSRNILAYILVPAWEAGAREDLQNNLLADHTSRLHNPQITHYLHNENEDRILQHIKYSGFDNNGTMNSVTVIYVPSYLNGADGIFNMPYYDLLPGMDVTVFPSYYEPWGYTPLESIAFGVPTITTSLSGFGRWIMKDFSNDINLSGVSVVERNDFNYGETCNIISSTINELAENNREQSLIISGNARQTAEKALWKYFFNYYVLAFQTAFKNNRKKSS